MVHALTDNDPNPYSTSQNILTNPQGGGTFKEILRQNYPFIMFSRSAAQAIQVMGYLARNAAQQPLKLEQVSVDTGIPRHAVVKVVQAMHKQRLLTTSRGSHGGVALAKSPGAIMLSQVVCAVDGPPDNCPVNGGIGVCQSGQDCVMYRDWEKLAYQVHTLQACHDLQSFAERNIPLDFYN
ncbi:MAG: Rrf2 family transcriptional regulator [Fidelibacterota bacterium]|nr:MAG: Rrf2 family transcriptional regulator [Candidatus Neomarinimicrobiota bacterium]